MKVNELIEKLELCNGEREVYTVGVGVEPDTSHEKLSIVAWLK